MKSLRSWFKYLVLGVTLVAGAGKINAQPGVNGITYQGRLENNGQPYNGNVVMDISFRDATNTTTLWTQHFPDVPISDGVFNVVLGSPFPSNMKFDRQYAIQVVINGSTTLPPNLLWSAPYALNSMRAAGMDISSVPVAGCLFPVPVGTGYSGTAKLDPAFLPAIPNSLLQTPATTTINGIGGDANGNLQLVGGNNITVVNGPGNKITIDGPQPSSITQVTAGSGLQGGGTSGDIVLSVAPGGITSSMLSSPLQIGSSSSASTALTVLTSETSGGSALMVGGGMGANNPTGSADGTGLSPGSPQTYWADQVSVPAVTTTSLVVYNSLVTATSTIILTPFAITPAVSPIVITAQTSGSFTVGSSTNMGTSGGGSVTALNYVIVNH